MEPPLHEGVLPGGAWGGEDLANPHPLYSSRDRLAVDAVSITEQVGRSRVIWERLDDLLGRPDSCGMIRHVELEEFATLMPKHDEDEEQTERESWDVIGAASSATALA